MSCSRTQLGDPSWARTRSRMQCLYLVDHIYMYITATKDVSFGPLSDYVAISVSACILSFLCFLCMLWDNLSKNKSELVMSLN